MRSAGDEPPHHGYALLYPGVVAGEGVDVDRAAGAIASSSDVGGVLAPTAPESAPALAGVGKTAGEVFGGGTTAADSSEESKNRSWTDAFVQAYLEWMVQNKLNVADITPEQHAVGERIARDAAERAVGRPDTAEVPSRGNLGTEVNAGTGGGSATTALSPASPEGEASATAAVIKKTADGVPSTGRATQSARATAALQRPHTGNVYRSMFSDAGEENLDETSPGHRKEKTEFDHLRTVGLYRTEEERKLANRVINGELTAVEAMQKAAQNLALRMQLEGGDSPEAVFGRERAYEMLLRSLGPEIRKAVVVETKEEPLDSGQAKAVERGRNVFKRILRRREEHQKQVAKRRERDAERIAKLTREIEALKAAMNAMGRLAVTHA